METPIAPRYLHKYNKELQRTYPDCRLRWSERMECWLLERKAMYARTDINPDTYPREAIDTFIQRRDGYYLAGRYEPHALPPASLLVRILLANDTTRMEIEGKTPEERAQNYMDALEEKERADVEKARVENSFEGSGVGSELYDQLAWAEGRRVTVPAKVE